MLASIDWTLLRIAQRVDGGTATGEPDIYDGDWPTVIHGQHASPPSRAFGVSADKLDDEDGAVSPSRVLAAYYLRNGDLLRQVLPHMASLGVPWISDMLVTVSVTALITEAEDPLAAYASMDALLTRLFDKRGTVTLSTVMARHRDAEEHLRQTRRRIQRSLVRMQDSDSDDSEMRHLVLAEVYKRLAEGPFKFYAWMLHTLDVGQEWRDPPMLTELRNTLVSAGGWLGNVADAAILVDLRNGEAHEALAWSGVRGEFVVNDAEVPPDRAARAVVLLDAFARGCEAAAASFNALDVAPSAERPRLDEPGRLPQWRRAQAFFGTNGLSLLRADFNSRTAKIVLQRMDETDVNPCFQALMNCQPLLPHVEVFEIRVVDRSAPVMTVKADALRRTSSVWETAIASLSAMPLATFLPANLDARLHVQAVPTAVRAVAWIAVDDLLDAVDGSSPLWGADERALVVTRIDLISRAVRGCMTALPEHVKEELRGVQRRAADLATLLDAASTPVVRDSLDDTRPVGRLRRWHSAWGPVERLPGIQPVLRTSTSVNYVPRMREGAGWDLRWRTI